MIGSIKKMFGGDSYYLEIDESKSVAEETPASTPVVEAKPEPVKVETAQPEVALEAKSEPVKVETAQPEVAPEAKPEPVKVETAQPEVAPEAKPEPVVEKKKGKKKAARAEASVTAAPSASNPLELIKAAVQKPTPQNETNGKVSEPTFAPDYLLYTKTQAKRRPGACMSSFLDMARKRR
ncbi:MAG: hypothetical protein J7647_21860 [Cyanobacteria bacterium SBLK]|nr:hypothetical protein [Cyanobacteria bacterium SBLK]